MARLRNFGDPAQDNQQGQIAGTGAPTPNSALAPFFAGSPGGDPGPLGGAPGAPIESRSGMTPRESFATMGAGPDVQMRTPTGGGNDQGSGGESPSIASPVRPRTPTPMAGSVSTAQSGSTSGVQPFTPMGSPDVGSMATPTSNGLFGSLGGLKGGGLGTPLDPTSNNMSDPISDLVRKIFGNGQARGPQ